MMMRISRRMKRKRQVTSSAFSRCVGPMYSVIGSCIVPLPPSVLICTLACFGLTSRIRSANLAFPPSFVVPFFFSFSFSPRFPLQKNSAPLRRLLPSFSYSPYIPCVRMNTSRKSRFHRVHHCLSGFLRKDGHHLRFPRPVFRRPMTTVVSSFLLVVLLPAASVSPPAFPVSFPSPPAAAPAVEHPYQRDRSTASAYLRLPCSSPPFAGGVEASGIYHAPQGV